MKRQVSLFTILCFSVMCAWAQTNVFVSADRPDDSGNGMTWETAKKTLAAAVEMSGDNIHIHVKVGEYEIPNELTIRNGVTVTGGYETGSTGSDVNRRLYPGYNSNWSNPSLCTILSGSFTSRIATVNSGGKIEGCVIRYGRTEENGGGVLINGGTVSHCVITDCMAYNNIETTQSKGGGAYLQNGGYLLNSVLCYNRADNGFGMAGTNGTVTNNTITQNYGTHCGPVVDADGHQYKTVMIGDQCWMRENLRVTTYANGTALTTGNYQSTTTAMYYNPGNSDVETQQLGLLYNRLAALGDHENHPGNPSECQGICPNGWHVPSNDEYEQMLSFLQHDPINYCGNNITYLAKTLASQELWASHGNTCCVGNDVSANNLSLFSAQPAGQYTSGSCRDIPYLAIFWTSTVRPGDANYHQVRRMYYAHAVMDNGDGGGDGYMDRGYSVRCVKNND